MADPDPGHQPDHPGDRLPVVKVNRTFRSARWPAVVLAMMVVSTESPVASANDESDYYRLVTIL